jgi:hypothetical protein
MPRCPEWPSQEAKEGNVPGASHEIRELIERAKAGGDWYLAPDEITEDTFVVTVACAPFGEDSWTAYDVSFERTGERHASFVFDISPDEGISPASSAPWDGWAAWAGADLVLAWSSTEDLDIGATTIEGGSPFGMEDAERSPEAWTVLARTITLQLMQGEESQLDDDVEDEYEAPRVQVILTDQLRAYADLADEELVRAHRWQAHRPTPGSGVWYARALIDGQYVYMHDLLVGPMKAVEHLNGDGLDNRRANLRVRKAAKRPP